MRLVFSVMISIVACLMVLGPASGCSDFILPFDKGKAPVISGRTMDFTDLFDTFVVKVPMGEQFASGMPGTDGKGKGLHWEVKYGYTTLTLIHRQLNLKKLGIPIQEMPVADGMNTEGLSVAALWLSYAKFPKPSGDSCDNCMDANLLVSYLLATSADVDDVIEKLGQIQTWVQPSLKDVDSYHLSIHDKNGKSIVVEYIAGKQHIYANDLGVLTNDPPYDWQAINYNYLYRHLQPKDRKADEYVEFAPQQNDLLRSVTHGWQAEVLGNGMYGMPGDSTAPSRFVRMAALRKTFPRQYDSRLGVQYALQLLGRVAVCENEVELEGNGDTSPTLWWVVRDHSHQVFYYATRLNHDLYAVDLGKLEMSKGSGIKSYPMDDKNKWYTDKSSQLQ